ncbi:head-tail connector protein [Methylocystis sp. S23]
MTISIDDLKRHLNITGADDDDLLQDKIAVATAFVEKFTGGPFTETTPAPLLEAVRQLAAHLYENREASLIGATVHDLPFGTWELITPYRSFAF